LMCGRESLRILLIGGAPVRSHVGVGERCGNVRELAVDVGDAEADLDVLLDCYYGQLPRPYGRYVWPIQGRP
jgi:hypothetical protein